MNSLTFAIGRDYLGLWSSSFNGPRMPLLSRLAPVWLALSLQVATPLAQALAQGAPIPLPPPRPAGLGVARTPTAAPFVEPAPAAAPAASAINQVAAPPKVATMDAGSAVERANAWFNANPSLIADFVQIGADGKRTRGKLSVLKPGRLRFEYASPATLEIIADGTSVAVRDRRLATQDVYFIGQTPLKFLLKEKVDIARDTKILGVTMDPASIAIMIEDRATFGGVSRINLVFDAQTFALKQWTTIDPQGYETLVTLSNLDLRTQPSRDLFKINTDRYN